MTRVTRNLASLLLSQIATWAVSAVMLVILPHYLSAADLGVFTFASSFVGYFGLIGALGTSTFLVKTIARDSSVVGLYVFNALIMKVVLIGILSCAAILLARVIGYPSRMILVVEITCLAMALILLNDVLRAALQGLERMGKAAAWAVVQAYASFAVVIAVLIWHKGLVAFALVTALAGIISFVANGAQLWPQVRPGIRIDLRVWKTLAVGGFPFLLWASVLVIYGTIDIPIIQALAGNATVGWYALAYAWVSMPAGFSSIVVMAVLPSLSARATKPNGEFETLTNQALRLVMFAGIPASAGIALVAPDMFALLHYQAGFQHAIVLIRILAIHIPIVGMDIVLGTALIARDRQRQWTIIGCVAAVFNPVLNLAAIPLTIRLFHDGAVGASVVTIATEALMMVGAIYLKPDGVLDRPTTSFIMRCAGATLVMIPAVLAVNGAVLPVKAAIGVLAYGGASFVLGTASAKTLRHPSSLALGSHELESVAP